MDDTQVEIFEEYFEHAIESGFSADIACCDACYDEFLSLWPHVYSANDSEFQNGRGEKGSGVFLLSLWTTARMHCRFESKLLGDVDHPVFATERPASLRARS